MDDLTVGGATSSAISAIDSSTARERGVTPVQDFETFLTLLTAQMRNQDPVNPIDSTQFISQLASFSSVEQQVKANEMLAGMESLVRAQFEGSARLRAGDLVELSSVSTAPETPIRLEFGAPESGVASRALTVTTDAGTILLSKPMDMRATSYELDPSSLPNGTGGLNFTLVDSYSDGRTQREEASFRATIYQPIATAKGWEYMLENGAVISDRNLSL